MTFFYKERLTQARMFWGLSLQDIGDELGVSKQYVQQIENGVKVPNNDFIKSLSELLQVKENFFDSCILSNTLETQCHFRKAKTTAAVIKERALQHCNLFEDVLNFISNKLNLPINNFRYYPVSSNEEIEKAAENCRRDWGINLDEPIQDIVHYLEKAGAVITYFNEISDKIDAFSVNKKIPIIIRNTTKKSNFRQRFDLAHECGHLIMHQGFTTGDKKTEKEADRFAGAFLIPRSAFLRDFGFLYSSFRINWSKLLELKSKWGVSLGAIIYRAGDLGIIDPAKQRSAFIYLSNKGYMKEEPLDTEIPLETPFVINKCLQILDNDGYLDEYLEQRGINRKFLEALTSYKAEYKNNLFDISKYRVS